MHAGWLTVVAALALVVGGCAGQDGGTDTGAGPTPEPSQSAGVNGSVLVATSSGTQRYPIQADGSLGEPINVTGLGSVIDGWGG